MDTGWVKIHRRIVDWEWYDDASTTRLFIHLILTVNHSKKKWRGVTVNQGERITSLGNLSQETGLSVQTIRTCLTRLKSTHELTIKTTNKFSLIKLNNWKSYQSSNKQSNNQLTINQQQLKNVKNVKNKMGPSAQSKKNMYEEPTIYVDELGEKTCPPQVKKKTFGKYPRLIVSYYMGTMGKRGDGRGYLPAAKELMLLASEDFPDDSMDDHLREIKLRIDVAKKHYSHIGSGDWRLKRLAEQWNNLPKWHKKYV